VALIMALDGWQRRGRDAQPQISVYEQRFAGAA
jgi:hypothetical protein